jgi:hypothetical protein
VREDGLFELGRTQLLSFHRGDEDGMIVRQGPEALLDGGPDIGRGLAALHLDQQGPGGPEQGQEKGNDQAQQSREKNSHDEFPVHLHGDGASGSEWYSRGSCIARSGKESGSTILGLELVLLGAAFGADPVVGQVLERRSRLDAGIRVSLCRIVNIVAHDAPVLFHGGISFTA